MALFVDGVPSPYEAGWRYYEPNDVPDPQTFTRIAFRYRNKPAWFAGTVIAPAALSTAKCGKAPRAWVWDFVTAVNGTHATMADSLVAAISEAEFQRLREIEESVFWPAYESKLAALRGRMISLPLADGVAELSVTGEHIEPYQSLAASDYAHRALRRSEGLPGHDVELDRAGVPRIVRLADEIDEDDHDDCDAMFVRILSWAARVAAHTYDVPIYPQVDGQVIPI